MARDNAAANASDYMTSREATHYLRVDHRTLLMRTRNEPIPAIPLGNAHRDTWLISKFSLDEHLRAIMTGANPR